MACIEYADAVLVDRLGDAIWVYTSLRTSGGARVTRLLLRLALNLGLIADGDDTSAWWRCVCVSFTPE